MTNRDSQVDVDGLVPDEHVLVKRSKKWAEMLAKYESMKESPDLMVGVYCAIDDEPKIEEPTVPSSEYESDDDGEGRTELAPKQLECIKKAVEVRNARMHKSGLDTLLDTFSLKEIQKVEKWLENNGNVFSGFMEDLNDKRKLSDIRIETRSKLNWKDGDSVSSVDTAKYILSNRNKRATKMTMTTIKEFRFQKQFDYEFGSKKMGVAQKQSQEIKSNCNDDKRLLSSRNFSKRHSLFADRSRKRNKRDSSSDLSSSEEQTKRERYFREKRLRRRTFSVKKRRTRSYSSSDSSSYFKPRKSNAPALAIRTSSPFVQDSNSKQADVNQNLEFVTTRGTKTQADKNPENERESSLQSGSIVLYTPKLPITDYPPDIVINGKVRITDKYLESVIGWDLKEKFLNGRESFLYECSPNSELLFFLPDGSVPTSESDDDILEKLNYNKNGRILQIDPISQNFK